MSGLKETWRAYTSCGVDSTLSIQTEMSQRLAEPMGDERRRIEICAGGWWQWVEAVVSSWCLGVRIVMVFSAAGLPCASVGPETSAAYWNRDSTRRKSHVASLLN
jgi:hypothetical protein